MRVEEPCWTLLVLCGACTVEPTQLVVAIYTDMSVPEELDAFSVKVEGPSGSEVEGPGRARYDTPITLSSADDLPATFGVRPRGGAPDRTVTVSATARHEGAELFDTRAVTSFVRDEQVRLDLFLVRRCRDLACPPEQTCSRDGCVDPEVPAGSLPDWNGNLLDLDASVPDPPAGWPKVIARTEEPALPGSIVLTDAVGLDDGQVWFFAQQTGSAWVEGDPAGSQRVEAPDRSVVWASCWDAAGSPCGLVVFGNEGASCATPIATRDARGRVLLSGMFVGPLELGEEPILDADGGEFLLRWVPPDGAREVAFVSSTDSLVNGGIAALPSGGFLLTGWVTSGSMTVGTFDGSVQFTSMEERYTMVFGERMGNLGSSSFAASTSPTAFAVASSPTIARAFSSALDETPRLLVTEFQEESGIWGRFESPSECSFLAAAAAADGTMAFACSVAGSVEVGGVRTDAPGDLMIGAWGESELAEPSSQALVGGSGPERIFDAAGGQGSLVVFGGDYREEAELDGQVLPLAAGLDALVFGVEALDGQVEVAWGRAFQSAGDDDIRAVVVDPTGAVVVAGHLGGALTIDETTIGDDEAVETIWAHRFVP